MGRKLIVETEPFREDNIEDIPSFRDTIGRREDTDGSLAGHVCDSLQRLRDGVAVHLDVGKVGGLVALVAKHKELERADVDAKRLKSLA